MTALSIETYKSSRQHCQVDVVSARESGTFSSTTRQTVVLIRYSYRVPVCLYRFGPSPPGQTPGRSSAGQGRKADCSPGKPLAVLYIQKGTSEPAFPPAAGHCTVATRLCPFSLQVHRICATPNFAATVISGAPDRTTPSTRAPLARASSRKPARSQQTSIAERRHHRYRPRIVPTCRPRQR